MPSGKTIAARATNTATAPLPPVAHPDEAKANPTPPHPMYFGNWYRPIPTLATQAALGLGFVIGYESGGTMDGTPATREQYKAACRANKLRYILQAPPDDATLAAEAADPYCLGWDQKDEPNDPSPVTVPTATLKANYQKWKAAAPNKIVLINYDGWQQWSDFDYKAAADCADWFAFDYYVRNHDGATADIKAVTSGLIDRFRAYLKPGQKLGFFLETCDQDLRKQAWNTVGVGPSPADVQAYFDVAVAKGVDFVSLFEDVIGAWFEQYTGTDDTIYSVIKSNVAKLATPFPAIAKPDDQKPTPAPLPPPVATPATWPLDTLTIEGIKYDRRK